MRGCQKRVIFIKSTGCNLFDEAYFVVSGECEEKNVCEDSMIAEANRIISESIEIEKERKIKRIFLKCIRLAIPFSLGIGLAFSVLALIN